MMQMQILMLMKKMMLLLEMKIQQVIRKAILMTVNLVKLLTWMTNTEKMELMKLKIMNQKK